MSATHNRSLLSVTVTLSSTPAGRASFGTVAYFCDQATNSLNSQRTTTYASYAEAETAEADGYISATTLAALQKLFAQTPKPAKVRLVRVNVSGSETYAQALTAALALTRDFYGVVLDTRTDAIQVAMSSAVESAESTHRMLFFFQSNDADWLTSGLPSAFTDIATRERTVPIYHDDDTERVDLAYAGKMLAFNPDETAAGWSPQRVVEVDDTAALTDTQADFLIANNCNVGLEFGQYSFQIAKGVTATGRDIGEQYAADVLRQRIIEDITTAWSTATNAGGRWGVSVATQNAINAIALGRIQRLTNAGHFKPGQVVIENQTITQDDIDARRLRLSVAIQYNQSTIRVEIPIGLSTSAVVEE